MYYSRENSALLDSSDFTSSSSTTSSYYSSSARNRTKMTYTPRKDSSSSIKDKSILTNDSDVNVGFSDLPNQIHRKTGKKGFEFTLMVAGESGLGKSTLVNSMFITDIYSDEFPGPSKRASKTVKVETNKVLLKEKTVNLALTIVDTPGFGCSVNNSNCWKSVAEYIESRYEEYLNAETRLHRKHIPDNRVHCCLYFIYPSGHSLKPIDIEFMLNLHDKVNIIPIIAKADTLTPEECAQFKKNVMNDISSNKIRIYEFPEYDDENSEAYKLQKQYKSKIPFAVVGSNYILDLNGERKRGRKYPWGTVEIENLEHCDFLALRNMIIKYYMLDLLDTTNNVHYENYRCKKLSGIGSDKIGKPLRDSNKNPLAQMEEEKKEHEEKIQKMKSEMEQVFEMKVKEKLQKLKDSEFDLERRQEQMNKMLEQQRLELEEKRLSFEKEKAAFELVSRDMEEMRRANTYDLNCKEMLEKEKKKEKKKGLF